MRGQPSDRWQAHPWLAFAMRAVVLCVPLGAGLAATLISAHLLHDHIAESRWWLLVPAAVSVAVCCGVERLTRRLLPLAALLKLSMLFPDRAPNRFKIARRANSVRALRERLAASPPSDASAAAEAALTLITSLTAHDRRTRGHCERVRLFADLLGEQLRLPRAAADRLRWASLLHDIGKLQVAVEILNKPAKLDRQEFEVISRHPVVGEELLGPLVEWLGEWGLAVRQHHEKWDGTGYPDGAAGTDISRAGRIVGVADAYEVMTAHRAYKKPMATVAARQELARCAGSQFDPSYVRAFLEIPLPKLLWAMGPGSLLMNLPLLRFMADAANKGVVASSQTGVAAMSAAAVIGSVGVSTAVADAPTPHLVSQGTTSRPHTPTPGKPTLRKDVLPSGPGATLRPTRPVTPRTKPTSAAPSPTGPTSSGPASTAPAPTVPTAPPPTTPAPSPTTPEPTPTPSAPTTPAPPAPPVLTAPAAPTAASAAAGDQEVVVIWNAPADDGGAPITGYTVTPSGPGGPATPITVDAATTSTVVTGLVNGDAYTFAITAQNSIGSSVAAHTSSVTPAGVPTAPTTVTAASGDQQATVSWAGANDNGSAITQYTVTPVGPGGALAAVTVAGSATSTVVPGLTNGVAYDFLVATTNAVGTSGTTASNTVTPAGVPGVPGAATAAAGDQQATVSWSAAADNGSPVTGYRITPIGAAGPMTPTTVSATTLSTTIGALTNGATYSFEIRAINAVGVSAPATSNAVAPAGAPLAPTNVTASADDAQATVFWDAADDNGATVTSYLVTPVDATGPLAPITVSGTATDAVIGGLTNGTSYTFYVEAVNAVGTSGAGVSGPVTPAAPPPTATAPAAPTGVFATAGLSSATVSWGAPADGGSPITSYTVTVLQGATTVTTLHLRPDVTTYAASGLTPGQPYSFTITADNAVGSSVVSLSGSVTPFDVPGTVGSVSATAADSRATVTWTPPVQDGGSPVTHYTVTPVGPGGPLAPITVPVGTTSTTVTGLTDGLSYTFRVTASNAYGTSAAVVSNAVTPQLLVVADNRYVVQGGTTVVDVLLNDVGDLDPSTVSVTTAPAHGTATAHADGTITYKPTGSYHGSDQFRYQACDTEGTCATALVTMTVLPPGEKNLTFTNADFHGADLHGIDFSNSNLSGADFTGANLTNVNFGHATVDGATFTGATMTGAKLNPVSGLGTDFSGVDLTGIDFTGANLAGADLSNANLTNANLNNVHVDATTNLTGANLTNVHGGPGPKISAGVSLTVLSGTINFNLLDYVTDANAPVVPGSITVTKQPAHGTLTVHADGTATYTANPGFLLGTDNFTFSISDVLTFTGSGSVNMLLT